MNRRAPIVRARLQFLQVILNLTPNKQAEVARLENELVKIEVHEKQYKCQRAYIASREESLPRKSPGCFHIVVYQDFVSQYTSEGKKINNLVFTIKWRDEFGALLTKYVDNICDDHSKKADSFYVINVWKYHLRSNEIKHTLETKTGLSDTDKSQLNAELASLLSKTGGTFEFHGVSHIL
jgi:hypothetical protein